MWDRPFVNTRSRPAQITNLTMSKATIVAADGARIELDVEDGQNIMLAAVYANTNGILGECGGMLSCATCHVYVEAPWNAKLAPPESDEQSMLDFTAAERRDTSRLSCQIVMTPALDGLVVHLPDTQV